MSAKNQGKHWNSNEIDTLRKKAKILTAPEIAVQLGRTEEAVRGKPAYV